MINSEAGPQDSANTVDLAIERLPGYYIRHLHQIAVAIFLQETEAFEITPVQFAVLRFVAGNPDPDQRTLARAIGLDASTATGVIDRLEARGLLERRASTADRRVRLIRVMPAGHALLKAILPSLLRAQELMLEPLPKPERAEFVRMLGVLVNANNQLSRAPKNEVYGNKKQPVSRRRA